MFETTSAMVISRETHLPRIVTTTSGCESLLFRPFSFQMQSKKLCPLKSDCRNVYAILVIYVLSSKRVI